jgi:hypothetical protein
MCEGISSDNRVDTGIDFVGAGTCDVCSCGGRYSILVASIHSARHNTVDISPPFQKRMKKDPVSELL